MEAFRKLVLILTMIVMLSMLFTECRDPVLHRVGGGQYTWVPNLNFTEWSTHQHFYVGDWLYFGFDKHRYNVLQVNKTSYEKCIHKDFIKDITRGGRDVLNLTERKPYYFICGRGDYCRKGMKVAVYVENDPVFLSTPLITNAPAAAAAAAAAATRSPCAQLMLPYTLLLVFFVCI